MKAIPWKVIGIFIGVVILWRVTLGRDAGATP